MSFYKQITSEHLDILKEVGNIGAGNAATALSQLLNKPIDMTVPNVKIVSFDEMMEMMGGADNVIASVFLRIEGQAKGSMFFMLPLEQASRFIQKMTGITNVSFNAPPYDEISISALQEAGNILSGSYLSAFSDFTKLKLYPSVPALAIDMVGAVLSYGLIEICRVTDYAIVIDTSVFEHENPDTEKINGHFLLLPDPDSFPKIFKSLGVPTDG
ncbi:chemotaxis protein CheC [Bacillus solimangrovi]|uniref:CheY-P-specific phosphatase CheC n=1 Tax=Bacillus solimangrovi TaxID=1305675 RepID=A0A1E5LB36_9BACI|nr:chemotaxis protein CheC [Bacillus solimangrovi]OEH91283.1 CheY-P-specific phosphatase CheC [Bacillus solimangrovi]